MDAATPSSLGYLVVESGRIDAWRAFATSLLGMQGCEEGGELRLRMDERAARIVVLPGEEERVAAIGWEVADAGALAELETRLQQAGHEAARESDALAAQRGVAEILVTRDPEGNRLEFFHGANTADTPFRPGRAISGFRTGALGLGHLALTTADLAGIEPFYIGPAGFHLSDYALAPFRARFFHLNSRHHSLALIETGEAGIHHLMVELNSLDDVGQAYDLAQLQDDLVTVTLGRHSNDFMTSFYLRSPSGFMIEYGWDGRSIDPEQWEPYECRQGPSLWGHERSWLGPEMRETAQRLRLDAAASGLRAPDFVRGKE